VEGVNKSDFDLTIVGGGIVGAMVAWRALRRRPEWHVLWVDRSLFGLGASAYAGALLTPFGRSAKHRAMLAAGFKLLSTFESETGPLSVRELAGWYVVSPQLVTARREWFLDPVPEPCAVDGDGCLRSVMPILQLGDRVALGPFMVRQGRPTEFIARIVDLCRASSHFSLWEGIAVNSWIPANAGIRLSLAGEREIVTDRLALATGAWAKYQLSAEPGLENMRVKRVAACHIEMPPAADAPVVYFGDHDSFLLPLPTERRWLFGFPSEVWDVPPTDFRSELDDVDRAAADESLDKYGGDLKRHRHGGRAFYDCYSNDRLPLVTSIGGDPRVVFVGACAGSGFRFSLGLAEQAIDLLDGGDDRRGTTLC